MEPEDGRHFDRDGGFRHEDGSKIEVTRRLLDGKDDTNVVMLTTFDMDDYVYEAFRAGASGAS